MKDLLQTHAMYLSCILCNGKIFWSYVTIFTVIIDKFDVAIFHTAPTFLYGSFLSLKVNIFHR